MFVYNKHAGDIQLFNCEAARCASAHIRCFCGGREGVGVVGKEKTRGAGAKGTGTTYEVQQFQVRSELELPMRCSSSRCEVNWNYESSVDP